MDSIIFDVDGTLWDSTDICAKAWTNVARKQIDPEMTISPAKLQGLFGRLLPDIGAAIFADCPQEQQLELVEACCEEEHRLLLKQCAPLYPRLEETLSALSKKYRLFIVSNCQAGYIEVFLQSSGLSNYFEGHLCPGDTGHAKAYNICKIIKDYHLQSPVYVGDTLGDFEATKQAGIPFVFASYGFGSVPEPDYIIRIPSDLCEIFLQD